MVLASPDAMARSVRFVVLGVVACLLVAAPLALALHDHAESRCHGCETPSASAVEAPPGLAPAPEAGERPERNVQAPAPPANSRNPRAPPA